jgi:hypothetical protein
MPILMPLQPLSQLISYDAIILMSAAGHAISLLSDNSRH